MEDRRQSCQPTWFCFLFLSEKTREILLYRRATHSGAGFLITIKWRPSLSLFIFLLIFHGLFRRVILLRLLFWLSSTEPIQTWTDPAIHFIFVSSFFLFLFWMSCWTACLNEGRKRRTTNKRKKELESLFFELSLHRYRKPFKGLIYRLINDACNDFK